MAIWNIQSFDVMSSRWPNCQNAGRRPGKGPGWCFAKAGRFAAASSSVTCWISENRNDSHFVLFCMYSLLYITILLYDFNEFINYLTQYDCVSCVPLEIGIWKLKLVTEPETESLDLVSRIATRQKQQALIQQQHEERLEKQKSRCRHNIK